ncbi:MAG TPA: amidohydrolase [Candidatus Obscuribacterales bacterium]
MPTTIESALLAGANAHASQISQWRRAIHEQPELGFCEERTSKYIEEQLKSIGVKKITKAGGTGLVAEIGTSTDKSVGLRADMDALPIQETTNQSYSSKVQGVMHACGHDAHVACVLGAAKLLVEQEKAGKLPGTVRLLFQPAEETVNAEHKSGATLLIEDGALKGMKALVALHVFPAMPAGVVGIRSGPVLAACDSFEVTIQGKGCHGAQPDVGVDAVVLSAQAVQALQTVVSRRIGANEIGLLTIGGIKSSSYAPNVVSDSVQMTGTVRYMETPMHDRFLSEINRALSVVNALGGSYTLDYHNETPVLNNDERVTAIVKEAIEAVIGTSAVVQFPQILGAEDFAFYTAHVPSCFFGLGVGIEGSARELHSPNFDINEKALPLGSALLAQSALTLLTKCDSI